MSDDQQPHAYRINVPREFDDVISHFYFAENGTTEPLTKTLLPSYQTLLVFSFGPQTSFTTRSGTTVGIKQCLVLGPVKQAFDYTMPATAQILVVNFKGDAFYRFFGSAAVTGRLVVDPNDFTSDDCFTALWNDLNQLVTVREKVDFILRFCKPYLGQHSEIAARLATFNDAAVNPIKTIAQETGQTERSIQLQQKKYFGYTSKEAGRYQRFLKAIEAVQQLAVSSAKVDWFDVIDRCGYYDQSQLIHDFRHYINLSPTQYLKFEQDICSSNPE